MRLIHQCLTSEMRVMCSCTSVSVYPNSQHKLHYVDVDVSQHVREQARCAPNCFCLFTQDSERVSVQKRTEGERGLVTVTIRQVTAEYAGSYLCTAINARGTVKQEFNLTVQGMGRAFKVSGDLNCDQPHRWHCYLTYLSNTYMVFNNVYSADCLV